MLQMNRGSSDININVGSALDINKRSSILVPLWHLSFYFSCIHTSCIVLPHHVFALIQPLQCHFPSAVCRPRGNQPRRQDELLFRSVRPWTIIPPCQTKEEEEEARTNNDTNSMWLELSQVFQNLSHNPDVRAIVLTGAGEKAFTAGLDVKAASQGWIAGEGGNPDPARQAAFIRQHVASFQDCISAIERCEKPVIVAMHGFALGLAIDVSTAADVRLCSRDVRFAVKEVDIGLAADIGTLSRLPKVVGNYGWVKEVALTARIFGADEALRVGFVNSVYDKKEDLVRAAMELGALMASKSPVAVQGTKEILNWSRDHSVQDGEVFFYSSICVLMALLTDQVFAILLSGTARLCRPRMYPRRCYLGSRSGLRRLRSCNVFIVYAGVRLFSSFVLRC